MNERFLKPYNPQETEPRIYKTWENSGLFNPEKAIEMGYTLPHSHAFTIVMPPPNVTGVLHMGHAMMLTIEDVIIRYKRMMGLRTLWIPGTDHAAIATQSKIEKEISKKEGKTRADIGRDELLRRIDAFAKESHDTIVSQIKIMGASCDWSREAFTLDDARTKAVGTVFKMMYDEGLIYQGERIVNWDVKGQTTIADDEIVYLEEKTKLYYLKYGPFVIATARPETKFGDKYVVMHPSDLRYKKYKHGETIDVEWINGVIKATIIKDESIDMKFGTGVMTITPWHSIVDFDLAEKHKLDKEQIIDKYGRLLSIAGEFADQKIKDAREKIVLKLEAKGLVVKAEDYVHNIATAERTGGVIEPQIMKQWFIAVNKPFVIKHSKINGIKSGSQTTLKEIMRKAVDGGQTTILPDYFNKTYFHWIDNLRDWCISRQIWYGHRIPVWYRSTDAHGKHGVEKYCDVDAPKGNDWVRDEDTLDTWFSSALWTFSTLGWPDKTEDLRIYHPTSVLETGYEILFFWVARMILMSGYALGTVPFETVYLHGTVRDAKGQKMSKSLGNGIDPIDVAREFGSDAGRMALVVGTAPGTDSKISNDKIKTYKHFANKIWNVTRFVLSSTEGLDYSKVPTLTKKDSSTLNELDNVIGDISQDMENMRFHLASEKIYHYIWHTFADVIIEERKEILLKREAEETISAKFTLYHILLTSLKMLHPFMPFITEEIWSMLPHKKSRPLLMIESWPIVKNK
jgi:valyl-tRNA synthetase